jgi:hypothetical protein
MFEDLLPAVERGIMDAAGSIPVVFKGIERNFEKSLTYSAPSRHDHHELTFIRSGKVEFEVEGRHVTLEKGGTIVIRPNMSHTVRVNEGHADVIGLYFGFSQQLTGSGGKLSEEKALHRAASFTGQGMRSTDIAPRTLEQFINFASGQDLPDGEKPVTLISCLG